MKQFRFLKDEKISANALEDSSDSSENKSSSDSFIEATSEDNADSIMFDSDISTDTFTISKIEERAIEEEVEEEEEIAVSLEELLQKARQLDKVSSKKSCAEIMLRKGLITQDDLVEILKKQGSTKSYSHQVFADMDLVPREKVLEVAAEGWSIPRYIDLVKEDNIDAEIIKMIPETKARRSLCIPVYKTESRLSVAMADPLDIFAADDIKISLKTTGLDFEIEALLAFPEDIKKKLEELYGLGDTIVQDILDEIQDQDEIHLESAEEEEEDQDIARSLEMAKRGPIITLVNAIIIDAVKQGASDIHIEPFRKKSLLRFRIDTRLVEVPNIPLPKARHNAIVSRIKIMSHCDISERRMPQDGRIHLKAGGKEYDLRVSIVPSPHGESVVMRLSDASATGYSLEDLGFLPRNLKLFQNAIEQPYGLILVTGPTGSGKTTTLYSALNTINSPEIKILTVENPIERNLDGAIQVQTKPEIGLGFGAVLKYFLRHDPDVVMVGEIRDGETATTSVEAALTGHMVFSTLHTNDAAGSIIRLNELGINEFLLASSIQLAQAQRLVRRICEKCKRPVAPTGSMLNEMERCGVDTSNLELYEGSGCDSCRGKGYKGMTALHELLPIGNDIRQIILSGNFSGPQIQEIAKANGMKTLREDGMEKVSKGVTTFEEVILKTMNSG